MLWVAVPLGRVLVRGVLQQWIEDWTRSRSGALLITSAIFGLLHLWLGGFPNWKWALVAGVLGWFCGRARNQAGSIRASMVTHALVATTWRAFFESAGQLIFQVQGRLAGAFAAELESCWRRAQSADPARRISVDLKNVTCIDRAGKYLLQSMHRSGVPFLRAGLAVQDILEQIMEQPECRH
jgi:anti-anti-sigma regulatory factor